jgi:hypothetical protein
LMFVARYARFMVRRWIVMTRRCMLLPMASTPIGTLIHAPQTTSLEL